MSFRPPAVPNHSPGRFPKFAPRLNSPRERAISEPFRGFFLAGWAASLIGLTVWPLFFSGVTSRYPNLTHAYLMIQGFFGAFTIGFLWTALPRMLEVPGPGGRWIAAAAAFVTLTIASHLGGHHLAGHIAFLAVLALIALFAARRVPARRGLPPPSFSLVAAGLVTGAAGTVLAMGGEAGWWSGSLYRTGRLLLNEVFLLLLVMGVTAFLAPRLLGQKPRQTLEDGRNPSNKWKRHAALSLFAGSLILLAAILQGIGFAQVGTAIMATTVTGFVLWHVPIWRGQASLNWISVGLRLSLASAVAAPWVKLFFSDARLIAAHLLLLGGFGLLTLMVGARVVLGHSGYEHLFQTRLKPLAPVVLLYVLSLGTRLTAEILPQYWMPLAMVSASLLILAHLVWGAVLIPKILRPRDAINELPVMRMMRQPLQGTPANAEACGSSGERVRSQ